MAEKKYCIKTETLAGFAKALGHPARIAIMKFLAKQNTCLKTYTFVVLRIVNIINNTTQALLRFSSLGESQEEAQKL